MRNVMIRTSIRGRASYIVAYCLAFCWLAVASVGCDTKSPIQVTTKKMEVEVSPDCWVTLEMTTKEVVVDMNSYVPRMTFGLDDPDRSGLAIPWQGRILKWEGYPVPITLREWEGKLYMIGFDRTNREKIVFRYYVESGDGFQEIGPAEFPKRIATQNMWIRNPNESYTAPGGKRVYNLQKLRELDVNDFWFNCGMTANVWRHISTGQNYSQTSVTSDDATIREYQQKYDPIPLPTIIRTPDGWPEVRVKQRGG